MQHCNTLEWEERGGHWGPTAHFCLGAPSRSACSCSHSVLFSPIYTLQQWKQMYNKPWWSPCLCTRSCSVALQLYCNCICGLAYWLFSPSISFSVHKHAILCHWPDWKSLIFSLMPCWSLSIVTYMTALYCHRKLLDYLSKSVSQRHTKDKYNSDHWDHQRENMAAMLSEPV